LDIKDNKQTGSLLKYVASGDEAAFRKLFHQYADSLQSYIYQLTRSNEMADEVVQDIFLKIWMSRESLEYIQNFRNYLFVISRNHALNLLKKSVRERKRYQSWELFQLRNSQFSAEDQEPILSVIDQGINQLPPQQYKIWNLRRRQGLTYLQIADLTGLSKETVKKYLKIANHAIAKFVRARITLPFLLFFL
jgi:RNA polymerase sigma-70 factor (family 1)